MRGQKRRNDRRLLSEISVALVLQAAASVGAELLHAAFGVTRLSILFLAGVTVTASIRGFRAGLFGAVAGVVFYKIFLDLRTEEQTALAEDVLNLAIFLVVALITGTLAGRMHDEAARARRRADRMALLVQASRDLAEEDQSTFWQVLADTLARASGTNVFVLDSDAQVRARVGKCELEDEVRQLAAKSLAHNGDPVERGERWSARAVSSPDDGVVLVWEHQLCDPEVDGVVDLLAELASASMSRMRVRHEQVRAQAAEEAARLRETILSSISHDFRSPLSAIIGSATTLLEYGDQFEREVHRDLLSNIQSEGEKLNDFVGSLLKMSRLQAKAIEPAREPVSIDRVVGAAIERLKRHRGEALRIKVEGACEAAGDALLLEQAVYNILDNAVKYASPAGDITVSCKPSGDGCEIVVADKGPGLSPADQQEVFRKFRGSGAVRREDSSGLGLYIAKGFVEANGGSITARDRSDGQRGLEMVIDLPGDK
jgi:two-component system sensor histidine kinase KdpD